MSIICAAVVEGGQRALVITDSAAMHNGRVYEHAAKVFVLPTMNAAIVMRGHTLVCARLVAEIYAQINLDFDALCDALPQLAEGNVTAIIAEQSVRHKLPPDFSRQGVTLVGWSPRAQRLQIHAFEKSAGDVPFQASLDQPGWVSPPVKLDAVPQTVEELVAVARRQCAYIREHRPDIGAGGSLIIAELTPSGIHIRPPLRLRDEGEGSSATSFV